MYRTSLLPVTIFMLAHTLGVSQSAATGHQRLMSSQIEAVGGGGSRPLHQQQRGDDIDLLLRPAEYPSSAASSMESAIPEWMNSRPDKDNTVDEDADDIVNDGEGWEDVPNIGTGEGGLSTGPKDPVMLQQPPSPYNNNINYNRLMLLAPDELEALRHYIHNGAGVGGGPLKRGDKLKRMFLVTHLREQEALPVANSQTTKFNYRVPAESNIIRGNFDKRSPRCIANCMRQGLVHPIQCHSLCRKR